MRRQEHNSCFYGTTAGPRGAPGANDGTLFSAYGVNFDSTAPLATTAAVNGSGVDVFCVRPTEIFFYLNSNHVTGIAGPMVITSTGGIYSPAPDQMESWVHCRPAAPAIEAANQGYGPAPSSNTGVSGTFATTVGTLQAIIGTKDVAGQVDFFDWSGLPGGATMRVYSGQYDVPTGQILTQCSGLPTTPAGVCYIGNFPGNATFNNFTALPYANNNPRADTWIGQTVMVGPGVPAPAGSGSGYADDSGPGTNSFWGMSGIPGHATQINLDPDPQMVAVGGIDAVEQNDFANPTASSYPYNYITIVVRTN